MFLSEACMTFIPNSSHLKRIRRDLSDAYSQKIIERSPSEIQALVDEMFRRSPDDGDPHAFDQDVLPKTRKARRAAQIDVLVSDGISAGLAKNLIDRVGPSRREQAEEKTAVPKEQLDLNLDQLEENYRTGDFELASVTAAQVLTTDFSPCAERLIEILSRYAECDPRALHHAAIAHLNKGKANTGKAIEALDRQMRLHPYDAKRNWVLMLRGDIKSGKYGGRKDVRAGVLDYEAAVEMGDALAAFAAATAYHHTSSIRDISKALEFYTIAAEAGLPEAQTNLAMLIADVLPREEDAANFTLKLLIAASRQGDKIAQSTLKGAVVRQIIQTKKPERIKLGDLVIAQDPHYFTSEAQALHAADRLKQQWQNINLPRKPNKWFKEALASVCDHPDWKSLRTDIIAGRLIGLADEHLVDRSSLIARRESQIQRVREFAKIDWIVAFNLIDGAEPTRITQSPLTFGDDYELIYRLPPISVDPNLPPANPLIPASEPVIGGNLSAELQLTYRIDEDGDHVLDIQRSSEKIASVVFYRNAYVDHDVQASLTLLPMEVPLATSSISVVALDLPTDVDEHDACLKAFSDALAVLSWKDITWMSKSGHPPIKRLEAQISGYSEDDHVSELCVRCTVMHGLLLIQNRKGEFFQPIEKRTELVGMDFYDLSTYKIFKQGDPASPSWWDPDEGDGNNEAFDAPSISDGEEADNATNFDNLLGDKCATWLSNKKGKWASLTSYDLAAFTLIPEWELPDKMYFREMSPGSDPGFVELMEKLGVKKRNLDVRAAPPATPSFMEELALVGEKSRKNIKVTCAYGVKHKLKVAEKIHEVDVSYIMPVTSDGMIAAVASIMMGISGTSRAWRNVIDEDEETVQFVIRLGTMTDQTKEFLLSAINNMSQNWEREADEPFSLKAVYDYQGRLIDYHEYEW